MAAEPHGWTGWDGLPDSYLALPAAAPSQPRISGPDEEQPGDLGTQRPSVEVGLRVQSGGGRPPGNMPMLTPAVQSHAGRKA
jgi:hypothetical protein